MQAFYDLLGLSKTDTGLMVAIYAICNLALLVHTSLPKTDQRFDGRRSFPLDYDLASF